jgi:hypothetical protein
MTNKNRQPHGCRITVGGSMKDIKITAVIQDRTLEAISDGTEQGTAFIGNEADTATASAIAQLGFKVPMGANGTKNNPRVEAGFGSALEVAASMMAVAPHHVYFTEAPEEVMEMMKPEL